MENIIKTLNKKTYLCLKTIDIATYLNKKQRKKLLKISEKILEQKDIYENEH